MSIELKEVHNCHHLGMRTPLTSQRDEEFPPQSHAPITDAPILRHLQITVIPRYSQGFRS